MIIRSAVPDDLDEVIDLFRDASAWLAARGINQWQRDPRVEQVRRDIAEGTVFVGQDDHTGEIVATVTVDTFADPDFWGPEDEPRSALYLHRMIVARPLAGRRLGHQLTEWIMQLAHALGYQRVRLGCWRSNTPLQRYYAAHGWRWVRTVDVPWRESGALFEMDVRAPERGMTTNGPTANHPPGWSPEARGSTSAP